MSATRPIPVVAPDRIDTASDAVFIDLRSPVEFDEDHVPGAHNVPLFQDDERALIGTLYRHESPTEAFRAAAETAAAGVGALVARVAELAEWQPPSVDLASEVRERTSGGFAVVEGRLAIERVECWPERPVFLSCWRGGMRSRSVVALLRDLGLERAFGVDGGYKAYRRWVRERLEGWQSPPAFVLRGLTGVGKTLVLHEVERLRTGWTVDLEGLAGHRGSILGMVGLQQVGQKAFESKLAARLACARKVVVLEGESRKVGDRIVPQRVWDALTGATAIELTAPLERRIDVLVDDYLARPENREPLRRQLPFIEQRLGRTKWKGELVRRLDGGEERELVALLLERYYDPLYRRSESDYRYALSIDSTDPRRAAEEIVHWISSSISA